MATTWVFQRGYQRLHVQRQDVFGELRLVVWGAGVDERTQIFEDEVQLVACMTALDGHLVGQGWFLSDFFPERRSGLDRRAIPRSGDRRRGDSLARYTGSADVHSADDLLRPAAPIRP